MTKSEKKSKLADLCTPLFKDIDKESKIESLSIFLDELKSTPFNLKLQNPLETVAAQKWVQDLVNLANIPASGYPNKWQLRHSSQSLANLLLLIDNSELID